MIKNLMIGLLGLLLFQAAKAEVSSVTFAGKVVSFNKDKVKVESQGYIMEMKRSFLTEPQIQADSVVLVSLDKEQMKSVTLLKSKK